MTTPIDDDVERGLGLFRSLRFDLLKNREVRDLLLCILYLKASYFFSKLRYMKAHTGMSFFYMRLKLGNWSILGLGYLLDTFSRATGLFHVGISMLN